MGDHSGGFTRFAFDFTPEEAGETEIVVLVDNRFDFQRSPLHLEYHDWYHFGGISRPVTLYRLGEVWIDELIVETAAIAPPSINVKVAYGSVEPMSDVALSLAVDGCVEQQQTIDLDGTAGELSLALDLPGAVLWSPAEPNLHYLYVQLGADDQRERFGIRRVVVDGRDISINGQAVKLLGFNRHESHPQFGHAVPDEILVSDIQQLKEPGL